MGFKLYENLNEANGKPETYSFACPGCGQTHYIWVSGRVVWEFNGDRCNPTFSPSIKHTTPCGATEPDEICHYHIRNGNIEFCEDSTHILKGQTVPLSEIDGQGK